MRVSLEISTAFSIVTLLGCGPSQEDAVAAQRACRVGARFTEAAFDAAEPTPEQLQARAQFPSRIEGLSSGLEHASVGSVVEAMGKICPDDLGAVKAGIEHHVSAGGAVHPGLGALVDALE